MASLLWLGTTRVERRISGTVAWAWTLVVAGWCSCTADSNRSELVVVDVGGSGVAARVVGTVCKHEPSHTKVRRACTAGAHLVLPGCVESGGSAPVDIVRVAAADPAAWSHVRRYTIEDMVEHRLSLCCGRPDRTRLLLKHRWPP